MIRLRNIKAAWRALTSRKIFLLTTSDKNATESDLCGGALFAAAMKLRESGNLPKPRYDMMISLLFDPSVIMLSKGKSGVCYASYDCQAEQDFNDLKQCDIE